jgi:ribosomal protein L13E
MMDVFRRWFARTEVRLEPRAISGREVTFADGYSLLELERAAVTEEQAIAAGLPIDRERTSSLGCNVMQLEKLRLRSSQRPFPISFSGSSSELHRLRKP